MIKTRRILLPLFAAMFFYFLFFNRYRPKQTKAIPCDRFLYSA